MSDVAPFIRIGEARQDLDRAVVRAAMAWAIAKADDPVQMSAEDLAFYNAFVAALSAGQAKGVRVVGAEELLGESSEGPGAETEVDHRPRVVWRFEEAGYAPVRVVLTAEGRVAIEERTCPDAMGAEHWIELHVGRERPWLQSLIAAFVGLLTGRPHTAEPTGPTNGTDFETVIAARQREEELKTELGIGRR